VIELGDLHEEHLEKILKKERTVKMLEGFKEGRAVEALCQKCSYKERFNKNL
jgi:sulfatase maturation enzyme AslB (radical SAM superfamily)